MSQGCHCGGACCSEDDSLGFFLGALTPDEAAAQAMPKNTIRNTPGFTQAVYGVISNAAASGQFTDYSSQNPECTSAATGSTAAKALALVGSGSSLALQGAIQTGLITAGPATFGITIAIAGIVGLFSTIFNHHAQAIAKERQVLCAAGPAANNYLQIIRQGVANGQASPQDGINALQSLLGDYHSAVSSIMKDDASHCNSACVQYKQLEAIVAEMSSQFQDLIDAA